MTISSYTRPQFAPQPTMPVRAVHGVARRMVRTCSTLAAALFLVSCASAPDRSITTTQNTEVVAPAEARNFPPIPAGTKVELPAGTIVRLILDRELNSKTLVREEGFDLTVETDLVLNDFQVIPRGSRAYGEVVHTQKAGAFGKAAELLLAVRWIELNGQRIRMRHFRPHAGRSQQNTVMVLSFLPVVWTTTPFIRGSDIVLPAGTRVDAQVAETTTISGPITHDPANPSQELNP